MEVREGKDRRLGGDSEKLLTLEEAAQRLEVTADDLQALIRQKKLASFRLGGHLLRVRRVDVEALLGERSERARSARAKNPTVTVKRSHPLRDRFTDFFYFNDFYLVAFLILLTLLAIILTL